MEGVVTKVSEEMSDAYFEKRPRESQLGAWASEQSTEIKNREELEERVNYFADKFKDQVIPRPSHWGGYIVKPISIEFWQGRPNRMHDRIRYTLQENFDWKIERLAP